MKRLLLLSAVMLIAACTPATDNGNGSESSSSVSSASSVESLGDLPEGEFLFTEDGNAYGTVYVTGYATVEKVNEPFCEENCTQYDYVNFHVLETGNEEFRAFLVKNGGDDPVIGLGCSERGVIVYSNHSDEFGMQEDLEIHANITNAILSATEAAPVSIKLTKLPLTGGMGAPACYAHFMDATVWNDG